MIIDCVPFFNEFEVLDIRFHELDPVVDKFVLIEATQTYQGNPNPLRFAKNKHLFEPFLHKIEHIVIDFPADLRDQGIPGTPPGPNWWRERYQHDAITQGLKGCGDNDIIITTDCDEIPSADAVRRYTKTWQVHYLDMRMYYFYLNTMVGTGHWNAGSIQSYWSLKQTTPSHIRNAGSRLPLIENGGWHFSYIGGAQRIVHKIQSFAHDEHRNAFTLESATNVLKGNYEYTVDTVLPKYVLDNWDKFDKLGMILNDHSNRHLSANEKAAKLNGPYRPA
jgi:beta-1,4-mannosyl-glycoprotein beta-1,4-N-acetylglucosaminyltransferase